MLLRSKLSLESNEICAGAVIEDTFQFSLEYRETASLPEAQDLQV